MSRAFRWCWFAGRVVREGGWINAIGPIERIRKSPLRLKAHTGLCTFHRESDKAYAAIEASFSRVSVAAIIDEPGRFVPLGGRRCPETK